MKAGEQKAKPKDKVNWNSTFIFQSYEKEYKYKFTQRGMIHKETIDGGGELKV